MLLEKDKLFGSAWNPNFRHQSFYSSNPSHPFPVQEGNQYLSDMLENIWSWVTAKQAYWLAKDEHFSLSAAHCSAPRLSLIQRY